MTAATVVSETSSCGPLLDATGVGPFSEGTALQFGDAFDEGRFGAVHRCYQVNGVPGPPLIIKLLKAGGDLNPAANLRTVASLHAAIDRHAAELPSDWERQLQGVPFWAGELGLAAGPTAALISKDLHAAGYRSFEVVFQDDDAWHEYFATELPKRLELARSFASSCAVLEQLSFVHGDLNLQNLFVNLTTGDAAIIDLDSGVVQVIGDERPMTPGKPGPFIAPEATRPGEGVPARPDQVAERWSIGVLLHYLVAFGHPFFFLRDTGRDTIGAYLQRYRWPNIPADSELFRDEIQDLYHWYTTELTLPGETFRAFQSFATEGTFQPEKRPSGEAWARILSVVALPRFTGARVLPDAVVAGGEVVIEWEAPDASRVEIDGFVEPFAAQGHVRVAMERSRSFRLVAHNAFGSCEKTTSVVRVFPLPRIEFLTLPRPRPLTLSTRMTMPLPPDARRGVELLPEIVEALNTKWPVISLAPVASSSVGDPSSTGRFGAGPPGVSEPLTVATPGSAHLLDLTTARFRLPKLWVDPLTTGKAKPRWRSLLDRILIRRA